MPFTTLVLAGALTMGAVPAPPPGKAKPPAAPHVMPPVPPGPAAPEPAPPPAPARETVEAPALPPTTSTGLPRLVVLDLTPGGGIDPSIASSLSEAVAAEVSRRHFFEVTSQKDVSTMLGLERQKQMLGCGDEATACASELAGAIGARFVLSGSVTRLGDAYQMNLQTIDSTKARPLGRSTRIARSLTDVRALVAWAVAEATATPPPTPPSRVLPLALIGAGAAAAVAGGVVAWQGFSAEGALMTEIQLADQRGTLTLDPAASYRQKAAAAQQAKLAGLGLAVGGALLAGLGAFLLPSAAQSGEATAALVPTGNGFALVGVLP